MGMVTTYMRAFNGKRIDPYPMKTFKNKWWFDLEDVEGVLRVPSHTEERGNNEPALKEE